MGKTNNPGKSAMNTYIALVFEFLTFNRNVNPNVIRLKITTHQIESAHPFSPSEKYKEIDQPYVTQERELRMPHKTILILLASI